MLPTIDSFSAGVDVPIPTRPSNVDVAETYNLVVVTFVVLIFAGLKFVADKFTTDKLVDVAFTNIPLVDVTAVPLAEVKNNGPVSVPPANGK